MDPEKKGEKAMKCYGGIVLFVTALVTFLFPGTPLAEIYSWQDAQGNTHFTDDLTRVPPCQREGAKVETLPEEAANTTPAPATEPVPETEEEPPVDAHSECQARAQKERERWTAELEQDQDRLVELNRLIHRSTTSRDTNELQRQRVAVKDQIAKAEEALRGTVPAMEEECEALRYWQTEE
jgi:hypothetical protein